METDKRDDHWQEVLEYAKQFGFIVQAYGGVATLATHEVQNHNLSEQQYELNQRENS